MTITNALVLPGLVKELKHSLKMLTVKSLNILAYSGLSYKERKLSSMMRTEGNDVFNE